ncbi:hypothetical protein DFA_11313 [Cavenderia fasciculata]|uniref:Uncharacterized protein n=1 Tax=Cavenderia fasciculata TaxID=261658 RepID=F4QC65_CACFS|nr:uncharacterized protein DFA_11313 [Cavenderia fasciculata]EGG13552.1 hypothetical protein DFA_11313 [Cavenderia fasciculata]|eukprot:XP_004350256.1 hypothetical protein DFA_11313 [Cavenderia fasciculata]
MILNYFVPPQERFESDSIVSFFHLCLIIIIDQPFQKPSSSPFFNWSAATDLTLLPTASAATSTSTSSNWSTSPNTHMLEHLASSSSSSSSS